MSLGSAIRKENLTFFSNLERDVVYRSDFLLILFKYLEKLDNAKDIERTDSDAVGLFCSILN